MSLIDHFHTSIIQHYNSITVGGNLSFKSLMFLNFCLEGAMASNNQVNMNQ
jgi:hypothetical protein